MTATDWRQGTDVSLLVVPAMLDVRTVNNAGSAVAFDEGVAGMRLLVLAIELPWLECLDLGFKTKHSTSSTSIPRNQR